MENKLKIENITLERLKDEEKNYQLLEKWYQEKEIYNSFEQKTLTYKEIKNKYYPRTLSNTKIPVYMIYYDKNPIGIIQYQSLSKETKKIYNIEIENSYEIDIFIGEIKMHNLGIGKKVIDLISDTLFKEEKANLLIMCPLKENKKAIKCYQNSEYKITKEFVSNDTLGNKKKYLLMTKENNQNNLHKNNTKDYI